MHKRAEETRDEKGAHVKTQRHNLGDRLELRLTPLLLDRSILWCSAQRYKDKCRVLDTADAQPRGWVTAFQKLDSYRKEKMRELACLEKMGVKSKTKKWMKINKKKRQKVGWDKSRLLAIEPSSTKWTSEIQTGQDWTESFQRRSKREPVVPHQELDMAGQITKGSAAAQRVSRWGLMDFSYNT